MKSWNADHNYPETEECDQFYSPKGREKYYSVGFQEESLWWSAITAKSKKH